LITTISVVIGFLLEKHRRQWRFSGCYNMDNGGR
jgi:hypothetical protein